MVRIALVDDDKYSLCILEKYIRHICQKNEMNFKITEFNDGSEILTDYKPVFDVIFLDIEMKNINGMDAAEMIRKYDQNTILIFVTQMAQYAVRGYRVDALDYMVKPIDYYSFELVFRKIMNHIKMNKKKSICLNLGNEMKIVRCDEVRYIEVFDHYVTYNLGEKNITIKGTLAEAEKELDSTLFCKCNRSFIVNLEYITSVRKDSILVGEKRIDVSRARRKELIQAATIYYGGKI